MDTMTLSYADVELAKDVLYGLYADAAARGQPQVRGGNCCHAEATMSRSRRADAARTC